MAALTALAAIGLFAAGIIAVIGASVLVTVALRPVRAAEHRPAIPHLRTSISPGEPETPTS